MDNKYLDYSPEQLEQLINRVYNGKIDPMNLPRDLYEATVSKISEGVIAGFGKNLDQLGEDYSRADLLLHYLHNSAVFSAAKTFQQVNDMSSKLFNEDGTKRSFTDFRNDADVIFNEYNENWLRAEYNTAITQAAAGKDWSDIEENKDVLPLLRYVTVGDDRVRDEHAELDGITLPVDDPFWETFLPPNGFNCRCGVEQQEGDEKQSVLSNDKRESLKDDVPPLFQMNAGTDKVIFKDDHPYFHVADRYEILKDNNFGLPIPPHPRDVLPESPDTMTVGSLMAKAKESAKGVQGIAKTIAEENGAKVTPINLKSEQSILRKAADDYGGDLARISDAVRTTIVADNQQSVDAIIEQFRSGQIRPLVLKIKAQVRATDALGYSGNIVNIKTPKGISAEIQVNTAKLIYAKDDKAVRTLGKDLFDKIAKETGQPSGLGHTYYEEYRQLNDLFNPAQIARRKEIETLSREYYSHFQ